ncbi:carbonic anhydrase 12 isoform X2 [Ascaphus truei]|uniref:carbonic anhydrase 12 isoform X2 n=1 Tax=Ascaphus truei TaxID=8439 RepID=UPI003F59B3E0
MWGQDGESSWPNKYSFCGGVYQSPIDFHNDILQYDSALQPIQLEGYNASESFTISNNGHTVMMSLPPTMYKNGQLFRYTVSQLHFHWGNQANPTGSEHSIGGKKFAAEVHIVHYNSDKYSNFPMAMEAADGLAVLGILLEVGAFNPSYDRIFSQLPNVRYKGQAVTIAGFNVRELLPERLDEYYRYKGSLTNPPCNPSVRWTVFRNPVLISEEQLLSLETALYCTNRNSSAPVEMQDNYRRLQAIGDRLVSVSYREGVVLSVVLACVLAVIIVIGVTCWLLHRKKGSKDRGKNKLVAYTPAATIEENTSKV